MSTVIIDYGMGNLISVKRAFEECGADVHISDDPQDLASATHIVLPGVGAFADGMAALNAKGWRAAIRTAVERESAALLGICLGMQLLAEKGTEGGQVDGLGLIEGEVVKLQPKEVGERIPHVGWNELWPEQRHTLFEGIADGSDFYFVHSYHFRTKDDASLLATTPYCGGFASVVGKDRILGVQFHPEKSQRTGFQLIRNFLSL